MAAHDIYIVCISSGRMWYVKAHDAYLAFNVPNHNVQETVPTVVRAALLSMATKLFPRPGDASSSRHPLSSHACADGSEC